MKTLSKKRNLSLVLLQLRVARIVLTNLLFLFILFVMLMLSTNANAQQATNNVSAFSLGVKAGYDHPLFKIPVNEMDYNGGRYLGAHADYRLFNALGLRVDYANIKSTPQILIPNQVYYGTTPSKTLQQTISLKRNFIGIGPSFSTANPIYNVTVAPMVGYTWIKGGDAYMESDDPAPLGGTDILLLNTGFNDRALSAKLDVDLNVRVTKNLELTLGTYYLRHFGVHYDDMLDTDNTGPYPIAHGERVFDQTPNPHTMTSQPANIIANDPDKPNCMDLSSIGANLGVRWTFGKRKIRDTEKDCITCGCPDDAHKVVVTVRDELSQKVIPNADVALKDMQGNIVATGTTNTFGVVDFGEINHGNYTAVGNVYGVETTIATILDAEFKPDVVIQKEVLYTDLRFILKGVVVNKNTRNAEPNVVVTLTEDRTRAVKQDNSDGKGAFVFRLDRNSSYEIVGVKENKLSDIERASTVGLTRSTTLFVDLELGVDDFDCGVGTVLDVKYEYDKWFLTTNAKFELDRLVRYMKDHQVARIELSSHTDSRGRHSYNEELSQKRAQSAVDYIVTKGIGRSRIIAQGYGETRLKNRCADGVSCSEAEHRINRRTEAKLICN